MYAYALHCADRVKRTQIKNAHNVKTRMSENGPI